MSWYADLSPCDYFPVAAPLLAVGWLDAEHPYARGRIDAATASALFRLLEDPWQPLFFMGRHACELCYLSGGPPGVTGQGGAVAIGGANLFVPGDGVIYAAPSTIIHYIDAHRYLPPAAFVAAVHACPPMRSPAYLKALLDNGMRRG